MRKLVGDRKSRTVRFDPTNYLVTFDTKTQSVIGRQSIGQGRAPQGVVCESSPGRVVVRVRTPEGAKFGVLDVAEQGIEFKLTVPGFPRGKLLNLPGGRIATCQSGALVIDPTDWSWQVVGVLRPLAEGEPLVPRDWVLLGGDLYVYCDTQLGRIRDVARPSAPSG